jgi:hypothetical protein
LIDAEPELKPKRSKMVADSSKNTRLPRSSVRARRNPSDG